ncbi:MAG: MoaD/ThiS family protein [Candidatus Dormibacteraceae bacterium]
MATLRLPVTLAPYCGGMRSLTVSGATVREALDSLGAESVVRVHLLTESGRLRQHLHIFLGEVDVRDELDTPLGAGDELYVLQAMSGGRGVGSGSPHRRQPLAGPGPI